MSSAEHNLGVRKLRVQGLWTDQTLEPPYHLFTAEELECSEVSRVYLIPKAASLQCSFAHWKG